MDSLFGAVLLSLLFRLHVVCCVVGADGSLTMKELPVTLTWNHVKASYNLGQSASTTRNQKKKLSRFPFFHAFCFVY